MSNGSLEKMLHNNEGTENHYLSFSQRVDIAYALDYLHNDVEQALGHCDVKPSNVLILEMLTGKRPTDIMFSDGLNLHNYCKMKIPEGILAIVDQRLLMPFTEDQTWIIRLL
ncbi:putative non-specific serine/threonine protein kinase [Medicago truncatula]|nr:putative non-specific serine/threonine protein kinase [Medicago truncatula]